MERERKKEGEKIRGWRETLEEGRTRYRKRKSEMLVRVQHGEGKRE